MNWNRFQCVYCGSKAGYRSRPRTLPEKYILPVLLFKPVRCAGCHRRSYRPLFINAPEPRTARAWRGQA